MIHSFREEAKEQCKHGLPAKMQSQKFNQRKSALWSLKNIQRPVTKRTLL
jgi:hypothetical protein